MTRALKVMLHIADALEFILENTLITNFIAGALEVIFETCWA